MAGRGSQQGSVGSESEPSAAQPILDERKNPIDGIGEKLSYHPNLVHLGRSTATGVVSVVTYTHSGVSMSPSIVSTSYVLE